MRREIWRRAVRITGMAVITVLAACDGKKPEDTILNVTPGQSESAATGSYAGQEAVKDGKLSTPWPTDDYGEENTLAQENIDGILVLSDKVTSIDDRTFSNCKISEVVMPDTLEYIGQSAFENCDELTSLDSLTN